MEKLECKICGKRHGKEVRHDPCPFCGEPLLATPISATMNGKGKLWSVPHFGGKCKNCGHLGSQGGLAWRNKKNRVVHETSEQIQKDRKQKRSGKITIIFNPRWKGKIRK